MSTIGPVGRQVWCALPWFHKSIGTDGTAKPCCSWTGKGSPDSNAWLRSQLMDGIRTVFADGLPAAECRNCVVKESTGNSSWRRLSFDMAEDVGLDTNDPPDLRSIEVNLSNVCNLRCRTCNGDSSSKWVADEIAMGIRPDGATAIRRSGWQISDGVGSLRLVEFLGGEPMLHQDEIAHNLAGVADLSRLQVTMTTNGTVAMSSSLAGILSRCRHVYINVSIDGYGDLNDYIRSDSDWDLVVENLRSLDQMAAARGNIGYGICSVYSILNCNKLHDLWAWYYGSVSGLTHAGRKAVVIPLIGPYFYDTKNLPAEFKRDLRVRLVGAIERSIARSDLCRGLIDYLETPGTKCFSEVRTEFNSFNGYLDETRGMQLRDVNPTIYELFR